MVKPILIDIIDLLNSGISIKVSDLSASADVTPRTITDYLKDIKKHFLNERLLNTRGVWRVKKGGFLRILNITSEEMAVLIGLLRAAENAGGRIGDTYNMIVKGHNERTRQYKEILSEIEPMSITMRSSAQLLNDAIDRGVKVTFLFEGYFRAVQPFQLFMREQYWYLAGYEEFKTSQELPVDFVVSNTMKTYSLYRIKAVKPQEEIITYNFSKAREILPYAINGYISWDMSPEEIHLMIAEGLVNVLERAGAYRYWTRIYQSAQKGYILFKVRSVHKEFKDILPLIMKYSPNIIVQHPESLRQKIRDIALQQIEKIEIFIGTDPKSSVSLGPADIAQEIEVHTFPSESY